MNVFVSCVCEWEWLHLYLAFECECVYWIVSVWLCVTRIYEPTSIGQCTRVFVHAWRQNFYFQTEQCFSFLSSITHRYSNIPTKIIRILNEQRRDYIFFFVIKEEIVNTIFFVPINIDIAFGAATKIVVLFRFFFG